MKKLIALLISIITAAAVLNAIADYSMGYSYNCPQAYIETSPNQYQFIGGLFTGALRQDLQRNDMIPLPATMSNTIRIRIKGMQDETQYIDHAEVRQVVHPEGTVVVGDRQGELFIIRHLKMPNEVKAGNLIDKSKTLLFRDGQNYQFHITDSTDLSPIQLKFTRKDGDKKAVLVARMKNSSWGGYINNELRKTASHPLAFQAGYGTAIANSAMRVSLLTKNGWKPIDFFPPAGNTAERDLAMQIDLSDVEGKDVMIKMESPYRFWDLDQVGLSYEILKPVAVSGLCRVSATVNKNDFSRSIACNDGVYLALEANDQLELEFTKPTPESQRGTTATYLLTAGGYYKLNLSTNISQMNGLQGINLNQYSISKYKELGFEYSTFFRQQ